MKVLGDYLWEKNSVDNTQYMAEHATHSSEQTRNKYKHDLMEVVLHPGDMLLIPPFWIHEVCVDIVMCMCDVLHV